MSTTNIVYAEGVYPERVAPPLTYIAQTLLNGLIHEVVQSGVVRIKETEENEKWGEPMKKVTASMLVVTDKETPLSVENALEQARKEGMQEALKVVREYQAMPWEANVSPTRALEFTVAAVKRAIQETSATEAHNARGNDDG